jgi:hypothetical protein
MGSRRAVAFYGTHFSCEIANAIYQKLLKYEKRKHCTCNFAIHLFYRKDR